MRNSIDIIDKNWHISFFKKHSEMYTLFSRSINYRRINTEDSDEYIE
jgi:hypothetical protein